MITSKSPLSRNVIPPGFEIAPSVDPVAALNAARKSVGRSRSDRTFSYRLTVS